MARNGAGVYTLPVSYQATAGQSATATQHNAPLEDLETDMNTARPVVAGGTGATTASDARTNLGITAYLDGTTAFPANLSEGTWEIGGTAVTSTAAELNILDGVTATTAELNKTDGLTGNILTDGQTDTLTKGFNVTAYNEGTESSGTYTPDPANNNFQYAVNGGAHTLAPPASDCSIVVHYTNNGSAGTITTSAFDVVTGDSFTTTDTHEFICYITRVNSKAHLHVVALQ